MAKVRSLFVCQNCGASFPQWLGQCGSCKEWNTLVEEVQDRVQEKRSLPDSVRVFAYKKRARIGRDHPVALSCCPATRKRCAPSVLDGTTPLPERAKW